MSSIDENWKLAQVQYPKEVQGPYEWYMQTLPSKVDEGGNKFKSAWIVFRVIGSNGTAMTGWHDFGAVDLSSDDFEEQWKALVYRGKKRIDALNSEPTEPGKCSECGLFVFNDDYLCKECRTTDSIPDAE